MTASSASSSAANQPTGLPEGSGGDDDEVISLYASREKIYPRSVSGVFSNWRWVTVWITQLVFY